MRPCGYHPEPLAPLDGLREVTRTSVAVDGVWADNPGVCHPAYGSQFSATSQDAFDGAIAGEQRNSYDWIGGSELDTPTGDVRRLQVCRFRDSADGPSRNRVRV